MCFSAGASFASGIVISAIGVASVKKVYKPSQRVFTGHNNGFVMSGSGSFLQTISYFGMVLFCSYNKYFHLHDTQGVEKADVIITNAER